MRREKSSRYLALTLLVLGVIVALENFLRSRVSKASLLPFGIAGVLFLSTFFQMPSRNESEMSFRMRESQVIEAAFRPIKKLPYFPPFDVAFIDTVFKTNRHIIRQSQTDVRAIPTYPTVVIKRPEEGEEVKIYIEREKKARQVCEEYKLSRLYIPHAQLIDDKTVAQERLTLFRGYDVSEGVYLWGAEHQDPRIQNHFKEIFRELLIFVTKSGLFGAVRYDNIELTEDLKVGLFDLDDVGSYKGTIQLLEMVPLKWFEEMFNEAETLLDPDYRSFLRLTLPSIQSKVAKREAQTQLLIPFRKKIKTPSALIWFTPSDFATQKERHYAKHLVAFINETLSKVEVPFKEARIVELNVALNASPLLAALGIKIWRDKAPLKGVLEQLKAKGYIGDCDVSREALWVIYC